MAKFVQDVKALLVRGLPLPGTVLDPRTGKAMLVPDGVAGELDNRTFPNRMVQRVLRVQAVELIRPGIDPAPDMTTVRQMIEPVLADPAKLRTINGANSPTNFAPYRLQPLARLCVRKMMSRYWDNFSVFALDLSGAVMRQGIFVEKMCKIDWLHSPSARDTMARLLKKYSRFFSIMATHPDKVAVPTLDVDLAWHTHQLKPLAYYSFATRLTRKFIDHDDKMDESVLSDAFEWTSKRYQERYQEVYSECTCWYCEGEHPAPTQPADPLPTSLFLQAC